MSRSILLQLTRDSIQEVLEATRTIDKKALLEEYPMLGEKIASQVRLYLGGELRGSYGTDEGEKSLLEDIIYNAKKAAFESKEFPPISTSEYLHCEIELSLTTPDGVISEKDSPLLKD